MRELDSAIARELKRRLAAGVSLVEFKVFGSRAHGTAGEDSDMDVFIEVETLDEGVQERISEIVWEVGFSRGVLIVPLVVSRHEVEETPLRSSPIIRVIAEEGVTV